MTHHHLALSRVAVEDSEGKGGEAARGSIQAKAHPRASIGCVKQRAIGIYLVELLERTTWGALETACDLGKNTNPRDQIPPAARPNTPSRATKYPQPAQLSPGKSRGYLVAPEPATSKHPADKLQAARKPDPRPGEMTSEEAPEIAAEAVQGSAKRKGSAVLTHPEPWNVD